METPFQFVQNHVPKSIPEKAENKTTMRQVQKANDSKKTPQDDDDDAGEEERGLQVKCYGKTIRKSAWGFVSLGVLHTYTYIV